MATKDTGGRPTKLTPEIHKRIVLLVRRGNFRETAAAAAGVDSKTFRNWLRMGARGRDPYKKFSEDVDQAEADAEAKDIAKLKASKDWKATAWRLERRHQDRWGGKQRHEISGPDGGPVRVDMTKLSDDELERLAAGDTSVLAGAAGEGGAGEET